MKRIIKLYKGDITKQVVDVIVNAAHDDLSGGGGVDGAIHDAAGDTMTGECLNLPRNEYGFRCPIGECRMTGGYELKAYYILHTVGPVWRGGKFNEEKDLKNCYDNCFLMARMQGLRSISFPCISTGAYCFPKELAAKIAVESARNSVMLGRVEFVRFVCFDDENYNEYLKLMPEGKLEL